MFQGLHGQSAYMCMNPQKTRDMSELPVPERLLLGGAGSDAKGRLDVSPTAAVRAARRGGLRANGGGCVASGGSTPRAETKKQEPA